MQQIALDTYSVLGGSGLRVSPVALGTMTFGSEWGWGANEDASRQIFSRYVELGGNFLDTGNVYTEGSSERLLGNFVKGIRDSLVISTKYTLPIQANDPNSGGNHRKSMLRSVEQSLQRMQTDYIDILYVHAWDETTSEEEVLRALDDLVRSGKVLHIGISNVPAWRVATMQAIADLRGYSRFIALQTEFNLIQRAAERDLIPMAQARGLSVVAYSPLAEGVLAGNYQKSDLDRPTTEISSDGSRKASVLSSGLHSERSMAVAEVVKSIARALEVHPAEVALAWVMRRSPIAATLIGARTVSQFNQNLQALSLVLPEEQLAALDAVSALEVGYPESYMPWLREHGYMGSSLRLRARI